MILEVTQEHIDNGKSGMNWSCPIALALRGSGFENPRVYYVDFCVGKSGIGYCPPTRVEMTKAMRAFVVKTDADKPVKPHRFRIPGLVKP